jgi:hypothetical protein
MSCKQTDPFLRLLNILQYKKEEYLFENALEPITTRNLIPPNPLIIVLI